MATSFLDQFLDLGLLPGIDDTNFSKLEGAAATLASKLKSDAYSLRRYSYALLDADLPDDDPILEAVEDVVKAEWKTLRSSHTARPVQLLRAVLGYALTKAVPEAQFEAATILWLTASSVLPYSHLQSERQLIVELFREFGRKAEERAVASWDLPSAESVPILKLPPQPTLKVDTASADLPTLANNVQDALNQLPTYLAGVSKAVTSVQQHHAQRVSGTETRIKLLWWKEALYSPSLKIGYRRLNDPVTTLVTIAYDFFSLLPDTYPQSAEYFFCEVVDEVLKSERASRWRLSEFCAQAMAADSVVQQLSCRNRPAPGRVPLLGFLGEVLRREAKPADAPVRVGLGEDVSLCASDLAVWVLRELQASHLSNEKVSVQ